MVEQAQGLEQMGAQQRVQEVPRAQQQGLERGARPAREHHETSPPLALRQLPPLVLGLLPLLLLPLLLLVLPLLVLLLQAALRHAPRVSLKKTNFRYHHTSTTSTTSTTSKETLTYVSQLGSLLLCRRAPFLPPPPRPSLPSSPLLAGAINSATLYFLRAARTLKI